MILSHNRPHSKTNASLISMFQRISDVVVIFGVQFTVNYLNGLHYGYKQVIIFFSVFCLFQMIGGITDFYRSWRGVKLSTELLLILKNWTLSVIFVLGATSYIKQLYLPLMLLVEWYLMCCVCLIFSRTLVRFSAGFFRKLGYNTRNVAIAGSLPVGVTLAKSFIEEPWLGFDVIGIYDEQPFDDLINTEIKYAGDFRSLIKDAKDGRIDRIYIAMNMNDELKMKELIKALTDTTCSVILIPDVFTFNILQSRIEEVNGIPVVPIFETPLNGINMVLKRLEDIILSLVILTLISPILLIISLCVKLTSHGPVIFKQTCYGMDGKPIKVWKFRTMVVMENDNVTQATKNDVRVTKVGRFLRRTSLDELPQFFNVLFGGMSIVGPRPHAVIHNEQYRSLIEGYMLRHKVKPGITGWAQINGWRGETDTLEKMEKRVEYDLEYIREWSIWLDIRIIFLTIFKGFIGKTAY
ncbi:undecaprenyl-phosphate glucose phosphotransferase [Klebsiella pneumoniae]|uniref:undecaprenyl-phosphate glucose phosphotransferase n=1 Tax=Klebsiella pneumoniae TaxID=573 RepID=UPI0009BC4AB5|nr:undecaprenyl-phosphate glucose phosphotransferase [Klebsiella pneumoniae]SLR99808.1 UDP-phosphate glucose phosphotransferase [Klebsiella pneumoniae]